MMYIILLCQLALFAILIRTRHARVEVYRAMKRAPVRHINGLLSAARFTPAQGVKHVQ